MIYAVATLKAVQGKEDELKAALTEMVGQVKAKEQGKTLTYSLHVSETDPTTFVMYEVYADADAFAAHGKTEHMAAFGGKLRGMLDGKVDVVRMTKLTGVD